MYTLHRFGNTVLYGRVTTLTVRGKPGDLCIRGKQYRGDMINKIILIYYNKHERKSGIIGLNFLRMHTSSVIPQDTSCYLPTCQPE